MEALLQGIIILFPQQYSLHPFLTLKVLLLPESILIGQLISVLLPEATTGQSLGRMMTINTLHGAMAAGLEALTQVWELPA